MLTLEMITNAKRKMEEADREDRRIAGERFAAGLPSWDLFISDLVWKKYKSEALETGIITKGANHYVITVPPYPPARVVVTRGAGEDFIIPNPNEATHD